MSEKTLKLINVIVNKKTLHTSKKSIALNLIDIDKMTISDKSKHNNNGSRYLIGYKENDVIKPLGIVLPQMSGYIKYFDTDRKNMFFPIKNDSVLVKYNEIWNEIKKQC